MSLWSYVDPLLAKHPERDRILILIAERLADVGNLWLFRPTFDTVLKALNAAHQRKQITGCFILSNNGSARLVEVVRLALNCRVRKLTGATETPRLFMAGWHRTAPCRQRSLVKSWDVVQRCLASAGLQTLSRRSDLLFFDDLNHVLTHEIPHYVRVTPYYNYTPHALVYREIQNILKSEGIPAEDLKAAYTAAARNEEEDVREDKEMIVRPPTAAQADSSEFLEGLRKFLVSPLHTRRRLRGGRSQRRASRRSRSRRH